MVDKETKIEYYENGNVKKKKRTIREIKKHGLSEGWNENGQQQWHEMWENGELHELCEAWNGELIFRKTYVHGIQDLNSSSSFLRLFLATIN